MPTPPMPLDVADQLRHCTAWTGIAGAMTLVSAREAEEIWGDAWALTHRVIHAAADGAAFDWEEFSVTHFKRQEFVHARAVLTPILRCFASPSPRARNRGRPPRISFPAIAALSGRRNHVTAITQYRKWEVRGEVRARALRVARELGIEGLELELHRLGMSE